MNHKRQYPRCVTKASAILAAAFLAIGAPALSFAQTAPTKLVDPAAIEQQIASTGKSRVIVYLANEANVGAFARMLAEKSGRPAALTRIRSLIDAAIRRNFPAGRTAAGSAIKRFALMPAFSAELSQADLARLKADPNIVKIEIDEIKTPVLNATLPLVGLPSGPDSPAQEPSGFGRTIAVIDTGVQSDHPFLSPRVVAEACFVTTARCPNGSTSQIGPGAARPASGADHGTHVAGIAVGSYGAGAPVSRGVANRAGLVMVNVFGSQRGAYTSDIIRGLEYIESLVSANNNAYRIDAVNMSLGGSRYSGPCDSAPEKPIIDLLKSKGVLTVVAAGNGSLTSQMSSPACISSVISVAATNKSAGIASYTNINAYTTIAAPGGDSDAQGCVTSSVTRSSYKAYCGTSMAAPHVAGTIGVLRQANPAATTTEILTALTAGNMPVVTDTRSGGRISKPFLRVDTAIANISNQVLNTISVSKGVSGGGSADGTVTSSPAGIACGSLCSSIFAAGATVTLTAAADEKSRFAGWSGACSGTEPSCTVSLPLTSAASTDVRALFTSATVSLNTALDDTLTWSTTPSASDMGNWFGQTNVLRNGDASGTARSAAIGNSQTSSIQTTVTGPGTLTYYWAVSSEANFDFLNFYINGVRQAGRISGSVGFQQQSWTIPAGTHVLKWSYTKDSSTAVGADAGYLDTVIFTPAATSKSFTLTVTKQNSSYGTVMSSPAGINCGRTCSTATASFAANKTVKLTARPVKGRRFVSWSGACTGKSTVCTVKMSDATSVTASFR